MPTSKNSGGFRLDPLNCTVWACLALLVIAFWTWAGIQFLPTVEAALAAAGVLNDCRALSLSAADCTAYSQGGR